MVAAVSGRDSNRTARAGAARNHGVRRRPAARAGDARPLLAPMGHGGGGRDLVLADLAAPDSTPRARHAGVGGDLRAAPAPHRNRRSDRSRSPRASAAERSAASAPGLDSR